MLSVSVIVFREFFEIALILSIVFAFTKNVIDRDKYILYGIVAGISGSTLIAVFTNKIANLFEGSGQEILNAVILILAIFMIGWTVIAMKKAAKDFSDKVKQVQEGIIKGNIPLYTISIIIASAVFREGAEIVLFIHGIIASQAVTVGSLTVGVLIGAVSGVMTGVLLYYGIISISKKHLFNVTSILLIFLAAGMASEVANYLASAGALNILSDTIWDSSGFISESSLYGRILHTMLGYTDRPSAMQLVFYITTIMLIGIPYLVGNSGSKVSPKQKAA